MPRRRSNVNPVDVTIEAAAAVAEVPDVVVRQAVEEPAPVPEAIPRSPRNPGRPRRSRGMPQERVKDLSKRMLNNQDLSFRDYRGYSLRGTDFADSNLTGTDFSRADLTDARLQGAQLGHAIFDGANLNMADMREANAQQANFTRARLPRAKLSGADFSNANFNKANLTEANAIGTNFREADMSGANLTKADITGSEFEGAELTEANLTGATHEGPELEGALKTGAIMPDGRKYRDPSSFSERTRSAVSRARSALRRQQRDAGEEPMPARRRGRQRPLPTQQEREIDGETVMVTVLPTVEPRRGYRGPDLKARPVIDDVETLKKDMRLSHRDFTGTDMVHQDMRGIDLTETKFVDADLTGSDFRGSTLTRSDFKGAELRNTNFAGQNLETAQFSDANLDGADLSDVVAPRADFDRANMFGANLKGANLHEAKLTRANLDEANLREADLSDSQLFGASFEDATLDRADLTGASMRGYELDGASLKDTKLPSTQMTQRYGPRTAVQRRVGVRELDAPATRGSYARADLTGRDFMGESMPGMNLRKADLSGADFSHADLRGADLSYARVTGANFEGADLQVAKLGFTNMEGTNLQDANMSNAVMMGVDMDGVDMRGADLRGAEMDGMRVRSGDMSGVKHDDVGFHMDPDDPTDKPTTITPMADVGQDVHWPERPTYVEPGPVGRPPIQRPEPEPTPPPVRTVHRGHAVRTNRALQRASAVVADLEAKGVEPIVLGRGRRPVVKAPGHLLAEAQAEVASIMEAKAALADLSKMEKSGGESQGRGRPRAHRSAEELVAAAQESSARAEQLVNEANESYEQGMAAADAPPEGPPMYVPTVNRQEVSSVNRALKSTSDMMSEMTEMGITPIVPGRGRKPSVRTAAHMLGEAQVELDKVEQARSEMAELARIAKAGGTPMQQGRGRRRIQHTSEEWAAQARESSKRAKELMTIAKSTHEQEQGEAVTVSPITAVATTPRARQRANDMPVITDKQGNRGDVNVELQEGKSMGGMQSADAENEAGLLRGGRNRGGRGRKRDGEDDKKTNVNITVV